MNNPPLSLYVHFPWCIRKCPYCDFNSHTLRDEADKSEYVDLLIRDLENERRGMEKRTLNSIFMGGGTPSLFSARSMETLLDAIGNKFSLANDVEITMEANPGSMEHDEFANYFSAGINRISLGIQSFCDKQLHTLGRIHDSEASINAIEAVKLAGFNNFNLDIMYGLPDQSIESALADCDRALGFSPAHISFYQLTIEPNTQFYKTPPPLPDSDTQLEMQLCIQSRLKASGFHQYEVSAYSVPGKESMHNLNYWSFGDYLGIGAGAHSKLTINGDVFRTWKHKHPGTYMKNIHADVSVNTTNQVPKTDLLFEFLLNGLRLKRGFSIQTFEKHTGLPFALLAEKLSEHVAHKLIEIANDRVLCTERGYLFIDAILQDVLPETG